MKPTLLFCIGLFAVAMYAVSVGAHKIVGTFGVAGGLITIGAMYAAARWYDHRAARR
jgi:hypothetical protein